MIAANTTTLTTIERTEITPCAVGSTAVGCVAASMNPYKDEIWKGTKDYEEAMSRAE